MTSRTNHAQAVSGTAARTAAQPGMPVCPSMEPASPNTLALLRRGRWGETGGAQAVTEACSSPPPNPDVRFQRMLLEAYVSLCQGRREDGLTRLRQALATGREAGLLDCVLCQAPELLARLCAEALESGIEGEYVHRLIRRLDLEPPSPTWARWPYPVRIHTLGRPGVVVHGQALHFAGKAQKRPLEMLYCLVASGGRGVPVHRLMNALWDGVEDHDARGAFDTCLSRLRRLLGVPETLVLADGRLSLNDRLCWVDTRACERLMGEADAERDPACRGALLERILGLYQGDFLSGLEDGWAVLARERIRSRLMRTVRRMGQFLERADRWPEATRLYERIRELFPLDEDLCRRLIRSHIEQGEFSQAKDLYARCRSLLVKVLGVLPSATTVAMLDRLPPKPSE